MATTTTYAEYETRSLQLRECFQVRPSISPFIPTPRLTLSPQAYTLAAHDQLLSPRLLIKDHPENDYCEARSSARDPSADDTTPTSYVIDQSDEIARFREWFTRTALTEHLIVRKHKPLVRFMIRLKFLFDEREADAWRWFRLEGLGRTRHLDRSDSVRPARGLRTRGRR